MALGQATGRRANNLRGQKRTPPNPEVLSLNGAARHCGVSDTTIRRLVDSDVLPKEQLVPFAPWEIQRSDLDSEPVRGIVAQLKETGKLVLPGDASNLQLTLSV